MKKKREFSVLTQFEAGFCANAIEAVARLGKPIAEVCERRISEMNISALEDDLRMCIQEAGEEGIKGFIWRVDEARITYGFFAFPWVLTALEFLDQRLSDVEPHHIHWIQGLLFGYRADAIQRHLTATSGPTDSTSRQSQSDTQRSNSQSRCRIVDTHDQ